MKFKTFPLNLVLSLLVVIVLFTVSLISKPEDSNEYTLNEQTNLVEGSKLKPYFNSKDEFLKIYESVRENGKLNARAVILSHHYLTSSDIAQTLHLVNPDNIKNVILIGPDHFNNLSSNLPVAYTTKLNWDTVFGEVESLAVKDIEVNNNPFKGEHSIYTLIPFIEKEFPDTRVSSLIINLNANETDLNLLGENLSKEYSLDETLFIVSSDFTHEADSIAETIEKDSVSIAELRSDRFGSQLINSDCKKCFIVLDGYLNKKDVAFYLFKNSNSTDYGGEEQNITSYVFGLFLDNKKTPQINFVGDMMFDRSIRQRADEKGYDKILELINPILNSGDINIGNLEGPITENKSLSVGSEVGSRENYIFTFSPEIVPILKQNKFLVLNIGNNHILNFGVEGQNSTIKSLKDNGIEYFGDLTNQESLSKYIIKDLDGRKIAFVNYNEFGGSGVEEIANLIADIKQETDFVFVYTHWGVEYLPESPKYVQDIAHLFIDSGADVVVGSHPHVIQQKEVYKDKAIYFSLGNLVMDQYFNEEVKHGLILKVILTPDNKLVFEEIATESLPNGTVGLK